MDDSNWKIFDIGRDIKDYFSLGEPHGWLYVKADGNDWVVVGDDDTTAVADLKVVHWV